MKHPAWLGPLLVLFVIGWGWASLQPPTVVQEGPGSGANAMVVLQRLLADMGPHPVGTPPNREVERRLQAELHAAGLSFEVNERTLCGFECLTVRNLIVVVPGTDPERWIGLSTHYDSVWSGPGVGDDMAGVAAAVEILRTIVAEPGAAGVVAVFNEGEEANLYGAKAFVDSPWANSLEAMVNLEARGTTGPAYMFEINGSMTAMGRAYRQYARRPSVSGLYVAIYRMLPNNTDVAVYTDAGLPSANIAFLGNGERYHTPHDDLTHLDPRTLQHQVDQGLAMVRGLRANLAPQDQPSSALLFDVGGWFVVCLPFPWAHGLLVLGLPVVWLARPSWRAVAVVLGSVVGVGLTSAGIDAGVHAMGGSFATVEWLMLVAFWGLAVGGVALAGLLVPDERALLSAVGWMYVALALTTSVALPEGSYLFTLGLPAFGVALWAPRARWVAGAAGWMVGVLAVGLPAALGVFGPVVALPAVLALLPIAPLLRSSRWVVGPWVVTALATGIAVVAPVASPRHPLPLVQDVVTDGVHAWAFTWAGGFPRGGAVPYPPTPTTIRPPLRFGGRVDEVASDGFVPFDLSPTTVRAPGGWAADLRVADGHVLSIAGTQVSKSNLRWLGDTTELSYTLSPSASGLQVCIARSHTLPAGPVPIHPIHTGARTWSCITETLEP